jgi:hypothetical protein
MHLRIFLSSPGDVAEERNLAQQVIEQELPKDDSLRGKVTCECVRWDDPNAAATLPATLTPQEAIARGLPQPSKCDVVVTILWSRMGTPLPADYKKTDGNPYLSGTEYEYLDALSAKPPPNILVYKRKTKPPLDLDDAHAEEKLQQYNLVKKFFGRFQSGDGSLTGGYAEYETPQEFRDRLRRDLRRYIDQKLAHQERETDAARIKAPPPYRAIGRALRLGQVIPIIGAAASFSGRPPNATWDPAAPKFLPSGVELSRLLAEDVDFPSAGNLDDLAEVSSFYEAFQKRATLRERLRDVLYSKGRENIQTGPLYQFLAQIPVPLLIVSTNYDTQLEQAFRDAGRTYDLVIYPATDRKDLANALLWWPHGSTEPKTPPPNELDIDLSATTVVFKMHGSIVPQNDEWDSFVITEEDCVDFLGRLSGKLAIPPLFSPCFSERNLLFLGYNLRNWSQRVIFRNLSRYFARRGGSDNEDEISCWAIEHDLTELEVRLWNKRGVIPYQVAIDEFIEKLRASKMP